MSDPVEDCVQRYNTLSNRDERGIFVLYDDLVAAVQAEREAADRAHANEYQRGFTDAMHLVTDDLTARIDREVMEKDGDGLLDGLRYAVGCVTSLRKEQR